MIFDSSLAFKLHEDSAVASATKSFGFIIRNTKSFTNIGFVVTLLGFLVGSRLKYVSLIYYPIYSGQVQALEKVQRKFLKFLYLKPESVYPTCGYDQDLLFLKFVVSSLEHYRFFFNFLLIWTSPHSEQLLSKMNFCVP